MNMKNKKFASAVVALAAAVMMPVSQAAALAADTAPIQENEIALTAESDTESSAELLAKKAAPAAPAVTSATKNGKQLTVKWKAVSGADGYIVYRYDAATGSYDYFIENTNQYTWEDYTSRPKESGFRYYVLSYVNDGGSKVKSQATDYTDMIAATDGEDVTPTKVIFTKAGRAEKAIRLYWTKRECVGYEIYRVDGGEKTLVGTTDGSADNFRVNSLAAGTSYTFTARAFNLDASGNKVYGAFADNYTVTTKGSRSVTAPAKVTFTKSGKAKTAIRLYWNKQNCAGYEVYMVVNGAWKLMGTAAGTADNYRVSGLAAGTKYTFTARAYNLDANGNKVYGAYADNYSATTKNDQSVSAPAKPVITKSSKSKKAVRLYWNKQNCGGYEVYMIVNGSWKLMGTAAGTADNYRVSGLAAGTKYTFVMRAFNYNPNGSKVYSAYSDYYTATTKSNTVSAPAQVKITKGGRAKTAIRIYWDAVKCDGYEVYVNKNGSWLFAGTASASATNFRVEGLTQSTSYYFTVRAFNNSNSGKVFGEFAKNFKMTTAPLPNNGDKPTYINGVLIANKTYALPASYNPGGLTAETQSAWKKMQQAAWNDGINLWIASGFRSYAQQKTLYDNYVARDGKAAADTYSARPGHSEHQTGLAFDINNPSSSFNGTKEAQWIAKNCANYGFIVRFPKGKESSTGFMYESWHVRYVGKTLAKKITASGLSLEEYLGITSQYAN